MLPRTAQRVAAVAELTAEGMTRAQIAARLGITERAVTYLRQRARDGAA
ncbi:MAG: helix-turn-helix domain-containing protein [Mycolicibacterium sp.]